MRGTTEPRCALLAEFLCIRFSSRRGLLSFRDPVGREPRRSDRPSSLLLEREPSVLRGREDDVEREVRVLEVSLFLERLLLDLGFDERVSRRSDDRESPLRRGRDEVTESRESRP